MAGNRMRVGWLLVGVVAGTAGPLLAEGPPGMPGGSPASMGGASSSVAGDGRAPLPLLPMMAEHQKRNMRDHLAAVQEIVGALARDDMDAAAAAAGRIGYSESMGAMCEHMGAATPGFTARALDFHHTADTIAEAARRKDRAAALVALERTLAACVGCHASYRQEIVDEETWKRLTGTPAVP